MDLARWQSICERDGLKPIERLVLKQGIIYLAEKQVPGNPLALEPVERQTHYEIMWAVGRDRMTRLPAQKIKLSAIRFPFQSQRKKIAASEAKAFLTIAVKEGALGLAS